MQIMSDAAMQGRWLCRLLYRSVRRGAFSSLLLSLLAIVGLSLLLLIVHDTNTLNAGRVRFMSLKGQWMNQQEEDMGKEKGEGAKEGEGEELAAAWRRRGEEARNVSGQRCLHPHLSPFHPSIWSPDDGKVTPVDCSAMMDNWVYTANGTFHIYKQARKLYGKITCEYAPIVRGSDFNARHAPHVKPMLNNTPLLSDFFKVACVSGSGKKYMNIHSAVAYDHALHERLAKYAEEVRRLEELRRNVSSSLHSTNFDSSVSSSLHSPNIDSSLSSSLTFQENSYLGEEVSLSESSKERVSKNTTNTYESEQEKEEEEDSPLPVPNLPPPNPSPPITILSPTLQGLNLSVFMFGFDSLSRLAWTRLLPKTREHFVKEMGGIELEGYNIVGDGTPAALLPILTGKMEEELPEARRGFPGAKPVDNHPWIWKEFSKRGYVTAHAEDMAFVGTFQMRMLGFDKQPTDHNYRTFSLAAERMHRHYPTLCLGSVPRHVSFMNWFRDLFDMYRPYPKFFFGFHSEMSHDNNLPVQALDDDLKAFLQDLEHRGHLNNTLLILMADHGARFARVRATYQGKLEERMPYFAFRFPPGFEQQHPDIVRNVRANANRLTTPFDIHETFVDILNFTGTGVADISQRGVSLLKEIPKERTCTHAEVTPHWCACLEWVTVSQSDSTVRRVVMAAIETINGLTNENSEQCARLKLGKITGSARYVPSPQDKLAQKKISKYWESSSSSSSSSSDTTPPDSSVLDLYQVSFITQPGDGHFEVTCSRLTSGEVVVDEKDISRINKYGHDPDCVAKDSPHIRPYCYCIQRA